MALVMLPIGLWAVSTNRAPLQVDALAAGFGLVALVPFVQAAGGLFQFPAEAPLIAQYPVAIAILLLVSRRAETAEPGRLIEALFGSLLIAGLLSSGIALYQWLRLDNLGVLLAPMSDRPLANVGQPNNLATLLAWSLVGLWWAHRRGSVGGGVAMFAAAFMLTGLRLTQSRAGVLEVCAIGVTAVLARRKLGTTRQIVPWLVLAAWFAVWLFAFDPLSRALYLQPTRALQDMASPQERTVLLKMVLTAIQDRPWFGYGWYQNVTAHVALATQFPMHGTVGNAHNLFLDLMIWNGVPLAVLLIAGLCWWFFRALWRPASAEHVLVALALFVLAIHTMLELPHVLAYFLFPAAIMMGTINAWRPLRTFWTLPRWILALPILLMGLLLVVEFREYLDIEARAINVAKLDARIAYVTPLPDPTPMVLRSLQDSLHTLATQPVHGMSATELDHMRSAVIRYPVVSALFRYAEASAMNGRPEQAQWALTVLCALNSIEYCTEAQSGWLVEAKGEKPELLSVPFPKVPWIIEP